MSRIIRIVTRMNIGGPALHVAMLSRGLDARRFPTCVIAGQPDAREGDLTELLKDTPVRVLSVPSLRRQIRPWHDLRALFAILRALWRERPAIIHTHMAKAGTLGRLAGMLYNAVGPGRRRGGRARLVHTFHGHVLEGYFRLWQSRLFVTIERQLARRTDRLVAVGPRIQRELLALGIGQPAQWRVIPLGLDLSTFAQLPPANGNVPVCFGLVGRLVPIKHPQLFLQALSRLGADGPPTQGIVVGDGPLREELERETARLGLRDRVSFHGWRRDLDAVYGGLDVVCLTSWNEGTPVSLIEAMAAGRAVVATDVGGVRDVLEGSGAHQPSPIASGEYVIAARGVLVRSGDAEGFSAALRRLATDAALRRRLGEAGRAYALAAHNAERLCRDITVLYNELHD